jgi:hypothetical protein
MKRYFVTVQAVIRKTIEVDAQTRDEAVGLAHEAFTVENDGGPEHYNQETVDVEEYEPPEPEFPEPKGKLLRDYTTDDFNPKMKHWSDT